MHKLWNNNFPSHPCHDCSIVFAELWLIIAHFRHCTNPPPAQAAWHSLLQVLFLTDDAIMIVTNSVTSWDCIVEITWLVRITQYSYQLRNVLPCMKKQLLLTVVLSLGIFNLLLTYLVRKQIYNSGKFYYILQLSFSLLVVNCCYKQLGNPSLFWWL